MRCRGTACRGGRPTLSAAVRWASWLMPAQWMELMRQESIETTLRIYVGTDAQRTAAAAWAAFEAHRRTPPPTENHRKSRAKRE